MTQQLCPERTVLAAFGRGELTQQLFEQIAAHIVDCPSCQEVLDQLGGGSDALLAGLRQVRGKDGAGPRPDTYPTQHGSLAATHAVRTPPGYELLDEVGRGGMGMVHRARDTRLNREVAVKLLRDDCRADAAVCARFVAEAQITGQLQHPGIPAVHELGQLPDGRPFLAMKLVKGHTLHQMLHECSGSAQERGRYLAIFEQICQAVGYAHAHRVLHRDLKPSNIMVGAFGEVQVMDWGLAKLLTAPKLKGEEEGVLPETLPAATAIETPLQADSATRTGSVMGTPAYMAPEQAGGEIRRLDARSDVFGLGAILCEILTGLPPYQGKDVHAIRLQAVRGELTAALARLDACGAEPEVVALCKRCLAFQQEDRPADGGAAAAAVAAIRLAAEERARRAELERAEALVREAEQRNRRRVWLALAACLLMGLLASSGLGLWANHARQQAETAQAKEMAAREAEEARAEGERLAKVEALVAKEQAQKRQQQIEKGNQILTSIFKDLDLRQVKHGKESLEAVLAKRLVKAAEQIEGEAIGDPLMVADLQTRLGTSLVSLGYSKPAFALFEKSRITRSTLLGFDHLDTLASMNNLAVAYKNVGQLGKALPLLEATLRLSQAKLGPDHIDTLSCMSNLAGCYKSAGRLSKALPLYQEDLRLAQAKLGSNHPHTLTSMNNLALAYDDDGQSTKALPLLKEAVRLSQSILGTDHVDTLSRTNNLAGLYREAGQVAEALPLLEETLRLCQAKLGMDHPETLTTMNNLALCYRDTGQLGKAVLLLEGIVRLCRAKLDSDQPYTLTSMNNLAAAYRATEQPAKALPLFEETLRLRQAKLGSDHPETLISMDNLAASYQAAGQLSKALPLFKETVRISKDKRGADHPDTLISINNLAIAYCEAKQGDKAMPLFAEYFERQRKHFKPNDPRFAGQLANTALKLMACDHHKDAESYLRECLAIRQKTQPDAWNTFNAQSMLGAALLGQKKYAEAEPLLLEGYKGMKQRETKIPKEGKVRLSEAVMRLVQLYDAWGKPAEAVKWRKELAQRTTTATKPQN